MEHIRKLICIMLSALMLMSALSGCAEKEVPEEERFVLRAALCGRIASLDPAMNTDARAESIFCAMYENLMRMEEDSEGRIAVVPGIAKEYRAVENGDGTVDYIFTLRSSARWSDGVRVKARDFVYAWRRLADPETNSPNCAMLSMVQGYDAVRETGDITQLAVKSEGDTTLRVTLSAPCGYFLTEVCTAVATMPLRSDMVNKDPEWAATTGVVSDGAYQLGVWAKADYIQLRRNSSYYGNHAAGPDVLRFLFAANTQELWQAYEDGRADCAAYPPEQVEPSGSVSLRSTTYVLYNHMSEIFSNDYVRKAFDLTLDRAAVASAVGAGATAATGVVPPGIIAAVADAEEDFRGVGGELCAVDAEGYSMRCLDAEGELRNGGYWGGVGFPTVNCIYVAGDETRLAASAAASMWHEKLNVSVTTEGLPREEFDRRVLGGEYDLAIDTLTAPSGDAMEYLAPFAGTDGSNAAHYVSTPFDLLIGVASTSRDPAARDAFLHDAESLLLEDTAISPLYFGAETYVLRADLSGVRHDLRGNLYFGAVTRTQTDG